MRAEELKGHLDAMLLAALEDGPRHGYAVMEALRGSTGGQLDLPTGTIYPALRRLETAGLIAGSWSVVGGRRRREYQLTPAGLKALAGGRAQWHEFSAMVTAALARRNDRTEPTTALTKRDDRAEPTAVLEGWPCPNPA